MKTCPACHEQMKDEADFCTSCGASLKNTQVNKKQLQRKPPKKSKAFIWIILLIILIVALFTSYKLLAKKYSEEVIEEQFKTALLDQDKASLKKLIKPDDPRMEINDDSLNALFALIESERSIVHEMTDQLALDQPNRGSFSLKKDGKHYRIFDRYVINAEGYYIELNNTSSEETIFYLNDKKMTTLEKDEDSKEIGPFLTGSYLIKATSDDGEGEDMMNIKLTDFDYKLKASLDTEVIQEEAAIEEKEEKTFSRIKEDNDTYILPHSDSTHVDESDLYSLTSAELQIARNEIYARHGYVFETDKLQNYFNSLDWYTPNVNFDGALSEIEKTNAELIKSFE